MRVYCVLKYGTLSWHCMLGHACTSTGIYATSRKGSSYKPHEPPPEAIYKSGHFREVTILEITGKQRITLLTHSRKWHINDCFNDGVTPCVCCYINMMTKVSEAAELEYTWVRDNVSAGGTGEEGRTTGTSVRAPVWRVRVPCWHQGRHLIIGQDFNGRVEVSTSA